jgi:hypothetical protein
LTSLCTDRVDAESTLADLLLDMLPEERLKQGMGRFTRADLEWGVITISLRLLLLREPDKDRVGDRELRRPLGLGRRSRGSGSSSSSSYLDGSLPFRCVTVRDRREALVVGKGMVSCKSSDARRPRWDEEADCFVLQLALSGICISTSAGRLRVR